MNLPSLVERIAEFMQAEFVSSFEQRPSAIKIGGVYISIPHLSYSFWPPHKSQTYDQFVSEWMKTWEVRYVSNEIDNPHKVASWLSLDKPFLPGSGLRRKIKASEIQGFELIHGGKELVNEFWACYSQHIHRLGSLPLPKRFFTTLLSGFKDGLAEIFLLRHNGEVVGSACNIFIDGFYENVWFATSHQSQKLGSSYFLHAKMIEHAIQSGAEIYSFGRSTKGSGVHQFKSQWNTVEVPLLWMKKGRPIQGRYKLQALSPILKLLPYQLVVFLGDKLSRYIY